MNATHATHPTNEDLAAFSLGRLEDAASAAVEAHLATCETCRQVAVSAPADSFVAKVQASERLTSDEPSKARTQTLSARRVSTEVPAALRDHPRYQVQELLGAGGMGAVFKAQHKLMQRTVALKVIDSSLVANPGMVERFRREVQAAARLSHPNIVHAHDADQAGDAHFLVMEHVDGVSLARLVADNGPLPIERACDYIRQAACGLAHAHEPAWSTVTSSRRT